ncbi:MAG TPA: hypothetical protein VMQ52_00315 [Candidatus Saccharimonadales bacterium]|jgi:hypothetical protein|nr:hypothetical protein [Candidatus Saccharimonadales bacterium]
MAKSARPTSNEQRYFDIVPPNRAMPQSTSRPVVISNQPVQSDPMVRNTPPETTEPELDQSPEAPSIPAEEQLSEDVSIDNEADNSDEAVGPTIAEDNDQIAGPTPQPAQNPEPKVDPDEPLLPANASPDKPTATVSLPTLAVKSHRWFWIIGIIIILLIAGAIVFLLVRS